ncbi:Serine/threonine-protein kinase fray2 [Camellia lanceoleosa]|nr:Serine/threonine-protein kinase fray2 [Camellia lanceoleosa]
MGHRELLVSIRFNEPGWQWSGCFLPDHLGDTQVKMQDHVSGAVKLAHGHAPFSKYPPMKVLLLTLQNAPLGLDYERDKSFPSVFKVEVEEMNPEVLQPRFVKMQMTSNNKFIRCDGREMNLFTHSQLMFTP